MTIEKYRTGYTRALEEKAQEAKDSGCAESLVKFPGRALRDGVRELFSSKGFNKGHKDGRYGDPFDPSAEED